MRGVTRREMFTFAMLLGIFYVGRVLTVCAWSVRNSAMIDI